MNISQMKVIAAKYISEKFGVNFVPSALEFEDCEGDYFFSAIHFGIMYSVGMTENAELFFWKSF